MEGSKLRHGASTSAIIANSDCARYEVSPSKNWPNSQQADSMEEKEEGEGYGLEPGASAVRSLGPGDSA